MLKKLIFFNCIIVGILRTPKMVVNPTKDIIRTAKRILTSIYFAFLPTIKKYGKKLDVFEYKQSTKSTTIFEELVRIYDRKN
jgi:hypothetical protein